MICTEKAPFTEGRECLQLITSKPPESLSENCEGCCGEGFWLGPRRRGRRIPNAGCNGRANAGPRQKTRRPEGFRRKGGLASLRLGHTPLRVMARAARTSRRHASPSRRFCENSAPRNFQTGSEYLYGFQTVLPNQIPVMVLRLGVKQETGCIRAFPIGFPSAMEFGSEALPTSSVQPPGEPGFRQRRF